MKNYRLFALIFFSVAIKLTIFDFSPVTMVIFSDPGH